MNAMLPVVYRPVMQLSAQLDRVGVPFVMLYVVIMPLSAAGRYPPLIVVDVDRSRSQVGQFELCDPDRAYRSR